MFEVGGTVSIRGYGTGDFMAVHSLPFGHKLRQSQLKAQKQGLSMCAPASFAYALLLSIQKYTLPVKKTG